MNRTSNIIALSDIVLGEIGAASVEIAKQK